MRELHHYIIKSTNRSHLLPVFIHSNETIDPSILDTIGKYIEVNLEYIETSARTETSLLAFRDQLLTPGVFDPLDDDNFSIHFTTKNRTKYYTTIKFDTEIVQDTAHPSNIHHLTTTTLDLCSFELYLFISF